jgi:hypothetical protein
MLAIGSLAPAFAGEVYVPLASNRSVDGTVYRTKVWVSNPTSAARRFSATFFEEGTNGTQNQATPASLTVAPGGTLLLSSVAPEGKNGMLEISGAPQLVVTSRVEAIGAISDIVSSAHTPVVTTKNVLKANDTAHLQGLEKTARGTTTDFGLMNLSREATQCRVKAFRASGSQIGTTAVLSIFPLSVAYFGEAILALGENNISDARFEATCDKAFYAYALVFEAGGPETGFVTPSSFLDGDLVAGGGGPNAPGTVTFEQQGLFLRALPGASFVEFNLPLRPSQQYKKATVEFDLYVHNFPDGLFSGVTALRRNDRTMFFGMIVRNDRNKTILDMGVDDDVVQGSNNGPWREKTNYKVKFEYNTETSLLTSTLMRGGAVVETLNGRINHFDLNPKDKVIRIDFGQKGVADGAYFPPMGWQFSNLKVVFEPED